MMYNQVEIRQIKLGKELLVIFCLADLLILPAYILMDAILRGPSKWIYSNTPIKNSCLYFLAKNILCHRINHLIKGIDGNTPFVKNAFLNLNNRTNQAGKRDSRRNKFKRNEFELYKFIVNSSFFEEIIFTPFFAIDVRSKINEAKVIFDKEKKEELDLNFCNRNLHLIDFPKNLHKSRNASIEYQYFRHIAYENYLV